VARGAKGLEILRVVRLAPVDQLDPMINIGRRAAAASAREIVPRQHPFPYSAPFWLGPGVRAKPEWSLARQELTRPYVQRLLPGLRLVGKK
jgi:hypothetical protein